MSDKDSKVAEIEASLKDITECSICAETFKDPKVLSCLHTFCKDCLQQLVTKLVKSAGEEVPCPICRKKFLVPVDGCDKLQKNFFMERLIEMRGNIGPSSNVHVCESCLEGEEQADKWKVPTAELYCSDCQQKLCRDCHKYHLRNKSSKNHKMFNLEEYLEMGISKVGTYISTKSEFCEKHNTKPLDIYCVDCKEVACSICFVENHKSHEGKTVESASKEFKAIIQENVDSSLEFICLLKQKNENTDVCKSVMIEKYRDLEIGINKRREELKALIDTHTDTLLSELSTKRDAYLKRMNICSNDIGTLMSCLDSFESYCKQLSTFGTEISICQAMETLISRETELQTLSSNEIHDVLELPALRLKPRLSCKEMESRMKNYIGEIADPITQIYNAKKKSLAEFNSVSNYLSSSAAIKGLTILGDEIFLAVEINESRRAMVFVEVYDLKTLWFKRKWKNTKLTGIKDMQSSGSNKCLYILTAVKNSTKTEVIRFDCFGKMISSFPVSDAAGHLSVTDESNVLCIAENKRLEEYSADGQRLFSFSLKSADDSSSCMLAVKLNAHRFVVGYRVRGELGQICTVNSNGKTLKCVAMVGDGEQLEWPFYLGKDQDNNVIVVDNKFSRFMAFDANLIPANEPSQLHEPTNRSNQFSYSTRLLSLRNKNMEKIVVDESNERIFYAGFDEISVINYFDENGHDFATNEFRELQSP